MPPKCSDPLRGAIFQAARKRAGARRLPAAGASPAAPRPDSSAARLVFCVSPCCTLSSLSQLPPANVHVRAHCAVQLSCIRCVSCVARLPFPPVNVHVRAHCAVQLLSDACRVSLARACSARVRMRRCPARCNLYAFGERACVAPRSAWGRVWSFSYSGASEAVSAGLGPDLVIFLLRGLLAGAPEAASAGLWPDLVIFLLRGY